MLETNADSVKRYAPPPQRNRSLNRRKSGGRYENINFSYGNEGEKIHVSYARNGPIIDHVDGGGQHIQNEHAHPGLIPLDGCHTSEAAKLLNERMLGSCNALMQCSCRHFGETSYVFRSQWIIMGTSETSSPDGLHGRTSTCNTCCPVWHGFS